MWKFLDATSHIFCKTTRHSIKMHSILSPRHDRFSYTELSKNWMEYDDEIHKQPLQKTITRSNEHKTHKGYNTFFQDYIYFTEDKQGIIQFLLQMVAYSLNQKTSH